MGGKRGLGFSRPLDTVYPPLLPLMLSLHGGDPLGFTWTCLLSQFGIVHVQITAFGLDPVTPANNASAPAPC